MEEHTETPWRYHSGAIYSGSGKTRLLLADRREVSVPPWKRDNNLKFALQAVNNHEELVAAARSLCECCDDGADMTLHYSPGEIHRKVQRLNAAVLNATMEG